LGKGGEKEPPTLGERGEELRDSTGKRNPGLKEERRVGAGGRCYKDWGTDPGPVEKSTSGRGRVLRQAGVHVVNGVVLGRGLRSFFTGIQNKTNPIRGKPGKGKKWQKKKTAKRKKTGRTVEVQNPREKGKTGEVKKAHRPRREKKKKRAGGKGNIKEEKHPFGGRIKQTRKTPLKGAGLAKPKELSVTWEG